MRDDHRAVGGEGAQSIEHRGQSPTHRRRQHTRAARGVPVDACFDVGVNNVGDKQPHLLYANNTLNANTNPTDFDLMGRYYFGRITVKF